MLRTLAYHRVAESTGGGLDPALVSATAETFRAQMTHLRKWYRPVGLDDVTDAFLRGRSLPARAVHVTVDDAYRDFAEVTWPILRALDIPVTLFVPTGYPGHPHREFWWDRLHRLEATSSNDEWRNVFANFVGRNGQRAGQGEIRASLRRLPHDEVEDMLTAACREAGIAEHASRQRAAVLDWDDLRRLQREGVRIGAHTRGHVALSYVDEERAREEVQGSLEDIARELGPGPRALAYPYGIYNARVVRIAREAGCPLAFTTEDGLARPGGTEPLCLPRTNITPRTSPGLFKLRMLPWFASVDRWRHRQERKENTA